MPKANPIQTNFTGGEVSPSLYSRVDTAKYQNGAETLENAIVITTGGAKKRPGTKFVWYSRQGLATERLIPFVYNAEQNYMLNFSNLRIRFYTNGGVLTNTAQDITGATAANPVVITYSGSDTFANGDRVAITGVVGMVELNNREFTVANVDTGANTFELSGIDGSAYTAYTSGGSVAEIYEVATTYTGAECLEISVTQSADTLFIAHPSHPLAKLVRNSANSWTLSDVDILRGPWRTLNTDETITIKANDATGTVTLTSSADLWSSTSVGALWKLYSPTRTSGETEFGAAVGLNAASYYTYNGNVYYIVSGGGGQTDRYTPPTHKQGTVDLIFAGTPSASDAVVRFEHQGYAIAEIASYVSATEVTATVYEGFGYRSIPLQAVDPAMTGGLATNAYYREATKFWQEGAWNAVRGYPEQVTFFEQRLMATKVQTVYGSVSGNFADFEEGSNDDFSFNYTLASEQADVIRWVNPGKQLLIGTTSGEYVMGASSLGEAVTPSNIKISRETTFGSSPCNPVRVGNAVLFMQRRGDPSNAGRKLREMAYNFQIDGYTSSDLTIFAPHITGTGVTYLAYQADPDALVWGTREDGQACCLTYEREQEVTAWHRHILGGVSDASNTATMIEQIAVMPGTDGDELWMRVKRYVDGGTERYIERLSYFDDDTAKEDGIFTDCAITYSGASTSTITGLWPLRGQTVKYLSNGTIGTGTVSATGSLTLSGASTKVHIGLGYTMKVKTLDLEAGAAAGTAQGRQKRISNATIRLHRSQGGVVGVEGSTDSISYDDTTLFTGDKVVAIRSGWDASAHVYIENSDPVPFTVLAIMPELNTTG